MSEASTTTYTYEELSQVAHQNHSGTGSAIIKSQGKIENKGEKLEYSALYQYKDIIRDKLSKLGFTLEKRDNTTPINLKTLIQIYKGKLDKVQLLDVEKTQLRQLVEEARAEIKSAFQIEIVDSPNSAESA